MFELANKLVFILILIVKIGIYKTFDTTKTV